MDFAADAVMDAIAPPSARPPPAAQRPAPGESFDDRLAAANTDEAPDRGAAEKPDDAKADAAAPDANTQVAPQTAAPPQSTAALILQMIGNTAAPQSEASAEPDAPVVRDAADAAAPPPQPVKSKQELPSFAPEAVSEEAAVDGDAAQLAPVASKSNARDVKHAEPQTPQQIPPPAQPQQQHAAQTQAPPAPTQPPPQTPSQPTPEAAQAALAALGAAAPERPTQRPTAQPPQSGKTEQAEANAKSNTDDATSFEQAVNEKSRGAGQAQQQPQQSKADAVTPFSAPQAQQTEQPAQTQQLLPLAASSTSAATAQHAVMEHSAARAAPAASQVAREIVRQFDGENTRFELRLDPPELGRVEVRLEVSRDHRVTAVVAADSPQTLSELARHARELEQTLQSAGLELSDNGLSFDLRQSRDEANNEDAGGRGRGDTTHTNDALSEAPVTARPIGFERWRGVRIDVMV